MLSGYKYETADGKQYTVPVAYGDMSRQVANIIRDNSSNKLPSAPRIAVYISGVQLDRSRLGDSTYVSKVHIRERKKIYNDQDQFLGYDKTQGDNYTVERLMPTPYKLTVKADIWASNTTQKLQIMEQLMMMFNPSLELQTTDNFVDWTSLTVVELTDIVFENRTIPVGVDSEIITGTMTFETPIWISPPSKVKKLGVIHEVIMNIHDNNYTFETQEHVTISGFDIFVHYDKNAQSYFAELLDPKACLELLPEDQQSLWLKHGRDINWRVLVQQYPGIFRAGSSQIFLKQPNGNEIIGSIAIYGQNETKLVINFDQDTYPTNWPLIVNAEGGNERGTIDAIINPLTFNPRVPPEGTRYLILEDIGDVRNSEGAAAWRSNGIDLIAKANDIIEWNGTNWEVVLESATTTETVYTTNLTTGVQYKLEDGEWIRSFEGEYSKGHWRIVL